MNFKGSKTEQCLLKAFVGESKARLLYEMYADIAKKEGYIKISEVFLEAASHELSHAKNFQKFFENTLVEYSNNSTVFIGTTLENLQNSIKNEYEESNSLYPEFAEIAKKEGFTKIASKFRTIAKAEEYHCRLFLKYAELLEKNEYFHSQHTEEWLCIKCGYIHEGTDAPTECPACNHPQSYFTKL